MSKVKAARSEWFDKYIDAMLQLEPRASADDFWEEAWELSGSHAEENPSTVAFRQVFPDGKAEPRPGMSSPEWMQPGVQAPPGWRLERDAWRND
ncbi:hypothetical protein [Variovorax boronicumulans]|uniref:hypothetical protein n=1 Tax=Variovorax boronicumulans TaxID=436515 RepID=UPI00339751FA